MELYESVMSSNSASRLRQPLRVAMLPERGCWISLPPRIAAALLEAGAELPLVLRLTPVDATGAPLRGAPPMFAAWQASVAPAEGTLGLPSQLAACLGLRQGAPVVLAPVRDVPVAEAVVMEPASGDDWEVVDLNAGHLEDRLLEQIGVAALGQTLPLWARQAQMRLVVTGILPEGLTLARLAPGTELHIAPKSRIGDAAGGGKPQQLMGGGPSGAAGAEQQGRGARAAEAAAAATETKPPRSVWLRAVDAGPASLLCGGAAAAADSTGAASAPVLSWLTCAAAMSSATAASQALTLNAPAQLCASPAVEAAAGAAAAAPGAGAAAPAPPPRLAVQLVCDESVPWGHVSLAPPLRAALGVGLLDYLRLEQEQGRTAEPKLLKTCPAFELRALATGEGATPADPGERPAAAGGAAAAAQAGGREARGRRDAAVPAPRPPRRSTDGGGWASGLVSGLQGVLAGGLPDLAAGLIGGAAGLLSPQQQSPRSKPAEGKSAGRQEDQQQRGGGREAGAQGHAAKGEGDASGSAAGNGAVFGLPKGVVSAAVEQWLRLQLAGLVARAALVRGGPADGGDGALPPAPAAALPMTGPLLAHFRLPTEATSATAAAGGPLVKGSGGSGGGGSSGDRNGGEEAVKAAPGQDHLLVLIPQLPADAAADSRGTWWALPSEALGGTPGSTAGAAAAAALRLTTGAPMVVGAALAAPAAAERHASLISAPSAALRPAAFEWLAPPLSAARRRLAPRLDLQQWHALARAGLPLAGGPLVCGGSGSGKTALLHLLGTSLNAGYGGNAAAGAAGGDHQPTAAPVHCVVVSCRALGGARFERAVGVIGAALSEALARCPGLVLLDDLDQLCPVLGDGPEAAAHDAETAARVAEWLVDAMRWVAAQPRPVAFAATARDAAALPAALRQAGCLDLEIRLPAPGAPGRAAMLLRGLRDRGCELAAGGGGGDDADADAAAAAAAAALEALSEKADGFDAKDLETLLDRALHAALRRQLSGAGAGVTGSHPSPVRVTPGDLEAALQGFVPAAFRGVGRSGGKQGAGGPGAGPEGWQDVGGLQEAKAALLEALELPIKWRHLVAAAPLRLRTGLLLYGPPGCGKTHVVGAAVAAVGARLVTVKGPELLNKYIGASEAAVRDLFSRAAAAAPCVLFFDEFDAIAPPRGHDSTGVTDRVVNQLLTELDGVEGLKGVTVLAATSRPDLIDAALLRPGRLDRLVYCGMPEEADRLAILRAAARRTPLAADADLPAAAAATAGFTGADLSALLSEAQLAAVHEELEAREAKRRAEAAAAPDGTSAAGGTPPRGAPAVRGCHLERALSRARPSLPPAERVRLEGVYGRFMAGRDPELANRQARAEAKGKGKRATLA